MPVRHLSGSSQIQRSIEVIQYAEVRNDLMGLQKILADIIERHPNKGKKDGSSSLANKNKNEFQNASESSQEEAALQPPPISLTEIYIADIIPAPTVLIYAKQDKDVAELLKIRLQDYIVSEIAKQPFLADFKLYCLDEASWQYTIASELNSARLVVVLLSKELQASGYLTGYEMQHLLQRHEAGSVVLAPILRHKLDNETHPLAHLTLLPGADYPVDECLEAMDVYAHLAHGLYYDALDLSRAMQKFLPQIELKEVILRSIDPQNPRKHFLLIKKQLEFSRLMRFFKLKPALDGLSYYDAKRFTPWLGGRLASEEEWREAESKNAIKSDKEYQEWLCLMPEDAEEYEPDEKPLMYTEGFRKYRVKEQKPNKNNKSYALRVVIDIVK